MRLETWVRVSVLSTKNLFFIFTSTRKKAAKVVVLRQNFKVSETDLADWLIDLVLPLRLFVYI